ELDERTWDAVHSVNLKGTFFCAQQAARLMVAQGSGRIINIASTSALLPDARGAHYCASKAGVIALTKSLALALAPQRIAVNAVAPGLTDTAQPRYGMSEQEITDRGQAIPWGRIAQPEDIARAGRLVPSLGLRGRGPTPGGAGGVRVRGAACPARGDLLPRAPHRHTIGGGNGPEGKRGLNREGPQW